MSVRAWYAALDDHRQRAVGTAGLTLGLLLIAAGDAAAGESAAAILVLSVLIALWAVGEWYGVGPLEEVHWPPLIEGGLGLAAILVGVLKIATNVPG